jgi:hypothetical protein
MSLSIFLAACLLATDVVSQPQLHYHRKDKFCLCVSLATTTTTNLKILPVRLARRETLAIKRDFPPPNDSGIVRQYTTTPTMDNNAVCCLMLLLSLCVLTLHNGTWPRN